MLEPEENDRNVGEPATEPEPWPSHDDTNSQWFTRSEKPDITKIVKGD